MNLIDKRLLELRQEYPTADADRKRQIVIVAERIKKSAGLYPVKVEDKLVNEARKALL